MGPIGPLAPPWGITGSRHRRPPWLAQRTGRVVCTIGNFLGMLAAQPVGLEIPYGAATTVNLKAIMSAHDPPPPSLAPWSCGALLGFLALASWAPYLWAWAGRGGRLVPWRPTLEGQFSLGFPGPWVGPMSSHIVYGTGSTDGSWGIHIVYGVWGSHGLPYCLWYGSWGPPMGPWVASASMGPPWRTHIPPIHP